jgi:hypothetical protein
VGSKVGVTISADGAQARKEFDDDVRALQAFGRAINVTNATAVAAFRSTADEQRRLGDQIGASSAQMEKLATTIQSTEARIRASQQRVASATERIGSGLGNLARSGHTAGGAINTVLMAGADLAFMFGPQGAVLTAIAMTAAGIADHFFRVRDEMDRTHQEFRRHLNTMLLTDTPEGAAGRLLRNI